MSQPVVAVRCAFLILWLCFGSIPGQMAWCLPQTDASTNQAHRAPDVVPHSKSQSILIPGCPEPAHLAEPAPDAQSRAVVCLSQAENLFGNHRIREARGLFEEAIHQSSSDSKNPLPAMRLAFAHHALGHCLDYLQEADHGEKDFSTATGIYEHVDWPDVPVLGFGVEGRKMLEEVTGSGRSVMQMIQERQDWTLILQTNLDHAEALYRNKSYLEAARAFMKFWQRQNSAHPVMMCSMSNKVNGTWLGQPANDHLIYACLHVLDKDREGGLQLLEESLKTISDSRVSGSSAILKSLNIVQRQAEEYFRSGRNDEARALLEMEEASLKTWLERSNSSQNEKYAIKYLSTLGQMKSARAASKLYSSVDAPGSKEAEAAEQAYWRGQYDSAVDNYLHLFQSYPTYNIDTAAQNDQPGGSNYLGPPVRQHFMNSCLHVFEQDTSRGRSVLTRAWEAFAGSAVCREQGVTLLDPLEIKAEEYFLDGQLKRARALFDLENSLAAAPVVQGMLREYTAFSEYYLGKIDRLEQSPPGQ